MLYRENGQFKTSYRADQQVFPITQDRIAIGLLLAFAVVGVPLLADEYMFRAILIPFLILSLAALGLNILVGYCGQISLGTGAFMAVARLPLPTDRTYAAKAASLLSLSSTASMDTAVRPAPGLSAGYPGA